MARRKLVWARKTFTFGMTAAADGESTDMLSQFRTDMGILANLPGVTVMRIRADVFAANGTAGATPFFVGIRPSTMKEIAEMGTDPAFALTSAPQNDALEDWMYWRAIYPNHGADAVSGLPNASTYEIDVRAMRKLDEPGQTLGLYVGKGLSTGTLAVLCTTSVLLALP